MHKCTWYNPRLDLNRDYKNGAPGVNHTRRGPWPPIRTFENPLPWTRKASSLQWSHVLAHLGISPMPCSILLHPSPPDPPRFAISPLCDPPHPHFDSPLQILILPYRTLLTQVLRLTSTGAVDAAIPHICPLTCTLNSYWPPTLWTTSFITLQIGCLKKSKLTINTDITCWSTGIGLIKRG